MEGAMRSDPPLMLGQSQTEKLKNKYFDTAVL